MNQLLSHTEFLLHDHNCVIVPGFGGFVVNTVPPRKDGIAVFHAPACELVFNRDLTHNDGLLAQSYMKNSGMTFESAMQKVDQDVRDLKRQLRELRRVDMGRLGSFAMHDEKRFVYTPGSFVRPALFGLTQASLKPLIQIQPALPARKNESRQKWGRSAGISAAAVAAIALLMIILPAGDTTLGRQSARMISETGWFRHNHTAPQTASRVEAVAGITVNETDKPGGGLMTINGVAAPTAGNPAVAVADNFPRYYIVMGVYKGTESAQMTMQLLLDEGFHQTGWLERPERIDVYAASFTDIRAAEVYLREVHKKFPGHADAWILKR